MLSTQFGFSSSVHLTQAASQNRRAIYRWLKGIPQEVASRPWDELQRITADESFCALPHNEVMSLHGGEMDDLASCFIDRARVGSQVVKGNGIPVK